MNADESSTQENVNNRIFEFRVFANTPPGVHYVQAERWQVQDDRLCLFVGDLAVAVFNVWDSFAVPPSSWERNLFPEKAAEDVRAFDELIKKAKEFEAAKKDEPEIIWEEAADA